MKHLLIIVFLFGLFSSQSTQLYGQEDHAHEYPDVCHSSDLLNEAKELLHPDYTYDGFRFVKIKQKDKSQIKKLVFPLNSAVSFRYVFNRSELPKGSEINIYDWNEPTAEHLRFSSKDVDESKEMFIYEPDKDMTVTYIEITIPPAGDGSPYGCLFVLAGYKL